MRWSCPHCGVALAISDDKLGSGWSFSRCYKCAGFSLVRRSDVNLIKVDKAPAGEQVILPEGAEVPVVSDKAARNFKIETRGISVKGTPKAAPAAPPAKVPPPPKQEDLILKELEMPEPLPQLPARPLHYRLLPFAIAAAGITAVASGAYLYVEGQELWNKTKASVATATQDTAIKPRLTAASDVVAAPPLYARAKAEVPAEPSREITDQLHQHAMAPDKGMFIETRSSRVILRGGPGLNYPVVAVAQPQTRFQVADWNERWFKIIVDHQPLDNVPTETPHVAWVRNDLVQLVTSGDKNDN